MAEASAQPRETPAISPAEAARIKAEQTAQLDAAREARREASAQACPVTDAEVARYGAQADPQAHAGVADWWSAHIADVHAQMEAEARDLALQYPVTDAEVAAAAAQPEVEPEAAADEAPRPAYEAARNEIADLSAKVDQLAEQEAERRAEMDEAAMNEPAVREPQAEPELESAWQPGDAQGYQEPAATADAEPEMEIG